MAESVLGELLGQTLRAVDALEQVLLEEAQILAAQQRDPAAIEAIARRKQEAAAAINDLVRACDRHLAAQGLPAGPEGMGGWLQGLPAAERCAELRDVWRAIEERSARCRELNTVNGVQIGLLRQRVQGALSVLLGGPGGHDGYGPDGAGHVAAPSQSFYKA